MAKIASQMRYDLELYIKTRKIAEAELRSVNAQIEYFMKKGVEAYEKEHGEIALTPEDYPAG